MPVSFLFYFLQTGDICDLFPKNHPVSILVKLVFSRERGAYFRSVGWFLTLGGNLKLCLDRHQQVDAEGSLGF